MPVAGFGDGLRQNHQPLYRRKTFRRRQDMGPLVSAEEMSRCIHCTRCVRFTEEIAGVRNRYGQPRRILEIMPFIGKAVETNCPGNVIDLCPVGALTSKPFRFQRAYLGIEPP